MFDNSNSDINKFIDKCVDVMLETGKVVVLSATNIKKCKSTLLWDQRELLYRYTGEISKQDKCDPIHKSICMEIMCRHMRETIGIGLMDNGPNSLCPVIMEVDKIYDSSDF